MAMTPDARTLYVANYASGSVSAIDVERMAVRTGGRFYEARDAGALRAVYERIDALERAVIDRPRWRYEERFHGLLLMAVGLALLGALLRVTALRVLP